MSIHRYILASSLLAATLVTMPTVSRAAVDPSRLVRVIRPGAQIRAYPDGRLGLRLREPGDALAESFGLLDLLQPGDGPPVERSASRMKRVVVALLCLTLGCGERGRDDAWVAEVDGVRIPAAELRRMVEQLLEEEPDADRGDVVTEELNRLVSTQVALNRASEAGVSVADTEVTDRLHMLHGEEWKDDDPRYRESVRRG